jgi:hypothetical protein
MVRCIATIDHITMADEEYATIVCEAKGKEYVEEIMAQVDHKYALHSGAGDSCPLPLLVVVATIA